MTRVLLLPLSEYEATFLLLLQLLRIADTRQKTGECRGVCDHWWHRDLSGPAVLEEIRIDLLTENEE